MPILMAVMEICHLNYLPLTLINFLLGFSWTGISFYQSIENKTILIGISVLVGILFVGVSFINQTNFKTFGR